MPVERNERPWPSGVTASDSHMDSGTMRTQANSFSPTPMMSTLFGSLEQIITNVSLSDCPGIVGELERMKAVLWARMMASRNPVQSDQPTDDRLLTVKEAAEKLGTTKDYLYRHSQDLPFTVRLGPRHLRFSLNGIDRYIRNRLRR